MKGRAPMKKRLLSFALHAALAAAAPVAAAQTVTFMQLNDLHAHLTPHTDLVRDPHSGESRVELRGGLARTATLIERIRAENPNSVLMNIGDTFHGGVEALYTRGDAIVDPVNALGIDVGVPGNWDFAYGPLVTRLRYADTARSRMSLLARLQAMGGGGTTVKRPAFPNLAANISYTLAIGGDRQFLPSTLLQQVGEVRVGFIGLSSDIVPRMSPALAVGFEFTQGESGHRDLLVRHARQLRREGADLVVVMSELGLHKDWQLARTLPAQLVDVVFSAHTHEVTEEPLMADNGTWVVEAGNDGYLGRMDIDVDGGRVTGRRWSLLAVDESVPENRRVARLVASARAPFLREGVDMSLPMPMVDQRLSQPIDTVVGHVGQPLHRRDALASPFNAAFAQALRRYAGTELALTPGFRFDAVLGYEDAASIDAAVTVEDLYRLFPVPYTLARAQIPVADLSAIIETQLTRVFSPDAFQHSGGWLEGYAGLDLDVDLSATDGARIQAMRNPDTGEAYVPDASLSVAGCVRPVELPGTLCSYPGFAQVQALIDPQTGQPWTPVDFAAHALGAGLLGDAAQVHIHDLSQTPRWPQSAFVQPLW